MGESNFYLTTAKFCTFSTKYFYYWIFRWGNLNLSNIDGNFFLCESLKLMDM